MPLKFLGWDGYGYTSDAIKATDYAVDNGAKVLNNSWGGGAYSQSLKDAIQRANEAQVLFVAAAGNDGIDNDSNPHYPASYNCDNIISVLATDRYDQKPWWSHFGRTSVDLGAPGVDTYSTFPTYRTPAMDYYGLASNYETISGTSMATPHVVGAAALVWAGHPDWTHLQVKEALLGSVDTLGSLQDLCISNGRLNLLQAVDWLPPYMTLHIDNGFDPNECVSPGDTITYMITYDPNCLSCTNLTLTLPLPSCVYFVSASPATGNYNNSEHSYTWFWSVPPIQPPVLYVTVMVNNQVEPKGTISQRVILLTDTTCDLAIENSPVCCWGGAIIYVNQNAGGYNTGVTWADAYTNLQSALARAARGCGGEIWVAKGTYAPVNDPRMAQGTFNLVNHVKMYGGFAGHETTCWQRNLWNNSTILTGDVNGDGAADITNVVTAANLANDTLLDTFIIECGKSAGVYVNGGAPVIEHNLIRHNTSYGIRTFAAASPAIKNNWICYNDDAGIRLDNPSASTLIRNNTLVGNVNSGIYRGGGTASNVSNCILWENKDDLYGFTAAQIRYCCIKDPNDSGLGVIHTDPTFASQDPSGGNFHLRGGSPCENAGDPAGPIAETDIDGEDRVFNGRVDMGADEFQDCDTGVWRPADVNADGIINLPDFSVFAKAWLSAPADPNRWNAACDFNGDQMVNAADLAVIAEDWLWMACSRWITPARQHGDGNIDGIVNLIDYAALANAWLSSSGGPHWNALCDLNRDNLVNLYDLAWFAESWLRTTYPAEL